MKVVGKMVARSACLALMLAALVSVAAGQSTDVANPSAVRTNEVTGTISARDLGDPRVTDHYYVFTGNPGDVLITLDSRNLNGDVDVFTFSGLQPLLKFTVYAGTSSPITKSIYLRKQEDLILRVQGRTPNDDDAVYRIHFGGTFAPITSGPLLAESHSAVEPAAASSEPVKKGRRVSSTGARIYEPPAEVAAVPTPEPTPAEASESETKSSEAKPAAAAKPTARNTRTRVPATRRTRPTKPAKSDVASTSTKDEAGETGGVDKGETKTTDDSAASDVEKTTPPRRGSTRRSATARTAKPAPAPAQELENSGPRLLIETNDGTFVDRYMSSVRRVTVENGQVVVVGKDGKIQRVPLASVVRMTISP